MPVDIESAFYASIGVGFGLYWFFTGFRDLKEKRTIEDIPTSKISTGAVGTNVEIKGKIIVEDGKLITAPISNRKCAFYSMEIQKLVRQKNRSYWKTVDKYYSDKGFYVDDDSGATALVMVKGAKIKKRGSARKYRISSNNFANMPPALLKELTLHSKDLKKFKLKQTSWLFSNQYQFLEWCFAPGESLYVLGYADSGLRINKREKLKMKFFMQAKKRVQSDTKLKIKFDTNKDGVLSEKELEWGARVIGPQLQSKYSPKKVEELLPKTKMMFKKYGSYPYIISDMKEEDFIKSLSWQATAKLWGGPALSIGCLAYLLHSFFYQFLFQN